MELGKYSFGIGDRFSKEGVAQLKAIRKASEAGVEITPVWNKSNREHSIVHSEPGDTRIEADLAVKTLNWNRPYFVDADHINLTNVDKFIEASDFFTLDVAERIGQESLKEEVDVFIAGCSAYAEKLEIPGLSESFLTGEEKLKIIAGKFLAAAKEAGAIYRHLKSVRKADNFIVEISMDEVAEAQSPVELFFILKMIADQKIPVSTFAPKFSGRFNKGVDYVGDLSKFEKEFEADLLVIDYAIQKFGLPAELKLSVHSGSDKFSIYPIIRKLIYKYDKGIHLKTAGTTWLEEMTGLSLSGVEGLALAKDIYRKSYVRKDELCAPYADVIDINLLKLPSPEEVDQWTGEKFANTLRHNQENPDYNPNFRQLIHVGYKIAAEAGPRYLELLDTYKTVVGECVEENLYDRHIGRLFDLK